METQGDQPQSQDAALYENLRAKKRAFLAAFCESGVITAAAQAVGLERQNHYNWLAEDPDYAKAFAWADEHAADLLEIEARRRAKDGVRRPVIHQGQQVLIKNETTGEFEPLWEHTYSDSLLMFLLKGAKPDKYADRSKNENDNKNSGSLTVTGGPVPDWFKAPPTPTTPSADPKTE